MNRPPAHSRASDWGLIVLLAVGSLALGLVGNRFRTNPLPLVYRDQAVRLEASLPRAELAPETPPAPGDLSLPHFLALVQSGKLLILDARPAVFYRLGHVPGALSVPREEFPAAYARIKARLEGRRTEPIVVYCSDDSCEDSRLVQAALLKMGYGRVAVFPGGWSEWNDAGLPKEISQP